VRKEFLRIDRGNSVEGAQELLESASLHIYKNEIAGILPLDEGGMQILLDFFRGGKSLEAVRLFLKGRQVSPDEMQHYLKKRVLVLSGEGELVPTISLADNMFAHELFPAVIRKKEERRNLEQLLDRLDVMIAPDAPVISMSSLQKMQIEVIRAYLEGKECVLLDIRRQMMRFEDYAEMLSILYKLRERDMTFILMDHNAARLAQFADTVTIFRNARTVRMVEHTPFDPGIYTSSRHRMPGEKSLTENQSQEPVVFRMTHPDKKRQGNVSLVLHRGEVATVVYQTYQKKVDFIADLRRNLESPERRRFSPGHRKQVYKTSAERVDDGICVIDGTDVKNQIFQNLSLYDNICMMRGRTVSFFWRRPSFQRYMQKLIDDEFGRTGAWKQSMHELTAEEQLHALYMRCFLNSPKILLLVDPYAAASDQMLEMIPELVGKFQKRGTGVLVLTEQSWIASGQPVFYLDYLLKN